MEVVFPSNQRRRKQKHYTHAHINRSKREKKRHRSQFELKCFLPFTPKQKAPKTHNNKVKVDVCCVTQNDVRRKRKQLQTLQRENRIEGNYDFYTLHSHTMHETLVMRKQRTRINVLA